MSSSQRDTFHVAPSYQPLLREIGLDAEAVFTDPRIVVWRSITERENCTLDAGLAELNGVSFTKGCYIGQELTSRMKHRATSRKRILTMKAEAPLPASGIVAKGGAEIGELISTHGNTAFALIRLDRLEDAQGDVTAAQIPVALHKPAWLE